MAALVNLLVFLGVAIVGGLGSAWYMITSGSAMTTERQGPWHVWTAAGRPDADPYTRAYIARSGRLPISSTNVRYYVAHSDSTGSRLVAGCEYAIEGTGPAAFWWSLAAYDGYGQLFKNAADRYAFNASTVMRAANGSYAITLSRNARSGNWLPVSGTGPVWLVMRVYAADVQEGPQGKAAGEGDRMPRIKKVGCR